MHYLFVVISGEVALIRYPEPGQAMTLQRARAGDLLAEASLFAQRYHCDAVASADSELLRFPAAAVRAGMRSDPSGSMALTQHLAREVVALRNKQALAGIRSAQMRVLMYLRLQADSANEMEADGPWTAVASELGLAHEVVYRALAALERDGLIERHGRRVRLMQAAQSD